MIIGKIQDGIVLDHITAGKGMEIYKVLGLDKLDCEVAMILQADSVKMGKKDIIKIAQVIDLDVTVLGWLDPGITVNIIQGGKLLRREHLTLPQTVSNVLKCRNPRCITSTEQELPHVFRLCDAKKRIYRCIYCDSRA